MIEFPKSISNSVQLLEQEIRKLLEVKWKGINEARVWCPEIFESREYCFLKCK